MQGGFVWLLRVDDQGEEGRERFIPQFFFVQENTILSLILLFIGTNTIKTIILFCCYFLVNQ